MVSSGSRQEHFFVHEFWLFGVIGYCRCGFRVKFWNVCNVIVFSVFLRFFLMFVCTYLLSYFRIRDSASTECDKKKKDKKMVSRFECAAL